MKGFWRQNGLIILIIALLLSILLGVGGMVAAGNTDPVSNVVNTITAPVRRGIASVLDWAEGVYTYVFHYGEMQEEIDRLKTQVAQLEEDLRMGEDAVRENDQLRSLLSLQKRRRDFTFEAARVSSRSAKGWESTFTISKGASEDIAVGDCVVTGTGSLAGVVTQVGRNWSTVSSIINVDLELGGMVSRTLSSGILEGDFSLMQQGKLKLSYLPNSAQLMSGDRVLTSGKGDVYPSGLVVGRVEGVFTDPSGQDRYAVIQPDADLDSLMEVFVIKDFQITE